MEVKIETIWHTVDLPNRSCEVVIISNYGESLSVTDVPYSHRLKSFNRWDSDDTPSECFKNVVAWAYLDDFIKAGFNKLPFITVGKK